MKRSRRNSNAPSESGDSQSNIKASVHHGPGGGMNASHHEESKTNDGGLDGNNSKSPFLDKNNAETRELFSIYNKLLVEKNKRNPTVKKNWGTEEIKLLEYAVNTYLKKTKHGEDKLTTHDWKEIANFIPGRTESQCLYKWNLTKHKVSFRKSTWQTAEDNILRELVMKHGKKHWQKIANELNERMNNGSNRAGKQCRERWLNHLDDRIIKDPWSHQEDLTLLLKQQIIGNKWSDIVKYLPGRTENMVKNRFNTLAKQKREEKRNNSVKKLDEVLTSLEEHKGKDDKNNWIDEKIYELQVAIGKGDNKNPPQNSKKNIGIEEKKQVKYEEKRGQYETNKPSFDRDIDNSPFLTHQKEGYSNLRQMNMNIMNTPRTYDNKEEGNMLYDSTPQQYLNRRKPMEGQMGEFQSPYDFPKRQLPSNSNRISVNTFGGNKPDSSPGPMKFESNNRFIEPMSRIDQSMLSPSLPSSNQIYSNFSANCIPKGQNQQNIDSPAPPPYLSPQLKSLPQYLQQSMNSPCCISTQNTVIKLLKTLKEEKKDTEKLTCIKQLLTEFREYENPQKDKVLKMIDTMISARDLNDFSIKPMQVKEEANKPSAVNNSAASFVRNSLKEADAKNAKPIIGKTKSTNKVKNMLFSMHKEELSSITQDKGTKETKAAEPVTITETKNQPEPFQSPMVTNQEKSEKKGFTSLSRQPSTHPWNTPYMMTPGYEHGFRNLDQMQPNMYGKSPLMQSPSPAFRHFSRLGPETPQTGFNQLGGWQNDRVNLCNSPLLPYTGRNEQNYKYQQMDN